MKNIAGNEFLNTNLLRTFKRQANCFFVLLSFGIASSITVSAEDNATTATKVNIVSNGSFELETVANGTSTPVGWRFGASDNIAVTGAYIMDDKQAHSGKGAVSITTPSPDAAVYGMWISEPFEVQPGTTYSIEAWIKTSECAVGKGAWLWVLGYSDKKGDVKVPGNYAHPMQLLTGTQDWRKLSASIIIAKDIHWLRIACRLDGAGTALFDDVIISQTE
ncbi:MAG: hypothetical protein WCI51_05805 [Lentisphaerota bacterium]